MIAARDFSVFVSHPGKGVASMDLVVEGVRCGGCMSAIEKGLKSQDGIRGARVNLASKRLTVEWDEGATQPGFILQRLDELGFPAFPFAPETAGGLEANEERRLLRCLGVVAFAMMNIMLLSVSVWSGARAGVTGATRDMFHWLSALIALPAVAYAGRPFFESAVRALRQGAVNMDVPISLGVLLALILSVVQTAQHAEEAYFDSAVMLLMFLLAGRALDQRMRRKTREVAGNLAAMKAETATRICGDEDEEALEVPIAAIRAGDLVLARPGERISIDGIVEAGRSEVDQSLVTGETAPIPVAPGQPVYAGTVNMTGTLRIKVRSAASGTLLDEVNALLAKAVEQRSSYVRLADRAARLYAPLVHVTALATFLGWLASGLGWQASLVVAITVLIITCPCALGLAVPAVQVVAASAMFRRGILLNSGDALERLANVDTIVFDKTGTLTLPQPGVANLGDHDSRDLELAGALASASRHPLSRILAAAIATKSRLAVEEFSGEGVEAFVDGERLRLGSATFCKAEELAPAVASEWPDASLIFFRRGERTAYFVISQALRPDAREVVRQLAAQGYAIEILSGDRDAPVAAIAGKLSVMNFAAGLKPAGKIARLERLKSQGRCVLMVGDGLNDAPALAAAHVSISPVSATHLAQAHADAVFLGERLAPVAAALRLARKAKRLMLQNLWLAVLYNAVAVPVAIAGHATPLIAALAMSGSSILVTLNALRARAAGEVAS